MGSILGIADLPVSIIGTTVQIGGGMDVPKPEYVESASVSKFVAKNTLETDKFVSKEKVAKGSNPVLKMRNGIGKLMKHFSKTIK